ncbi:MAG: anaerobic ribonucleoside-triphosphate reductase activating protein [Methanospirillum sp.]|nr:anaerobic ribonucleoside-triphosphate reductase activating protein [Methanospirillum sp.]
MPLQLNFGGFVPLSTVDWPGRVVCTVFLRGCPARCPYCHNTPLLGGKDLREVDEVAGMIASSALVISGVIFTGGEPTMQRDALLALARAARDLGLQVGLHTNGAYPETLVRLIDAGLADHVALDLKARWERYPNLLGADLTERVQESLALLGAAFTGGRLPEFEVVITLFRGFEDEVGAIAREAGDVPLVLQQGVTEAVAPLTHGELVAVADRVGRSCRIRTRENGEIEHETDRDRGFAGKRQG